MGEVKQINIKNRIIYRIYYFYNDMINLKNFEPNLLKIDRKLYKNIRIYNIGYITIKKLMIMKIFTVWILCICFVFNHASGYIEEISVNKYLVFDSTDENKELLKNTVIFGMELETKLKQ